MFTKLRVWLAANMYIIAGLAFVYYGALTSQPVGPIRRGVQTGGRVLYQAWLPDLHVGC